MDVVRGVELLPLTAEPSAVTVGMFDGVHRGHQAVIGRTVEMSRERGIRSVATTFDRHPREVLTHGHEPRLLTTLERKISLIEALGVDTLLVLQFTLEFSKTSPEDFVRRFLVESVHAEHVVLGANFRFGYRASGDLAYLHAAGPQHGFTAEGIDILEVDGRKVRVGVQGSRIAALNQMIPLGRGGTPAEAAGAIYLFCSPDSDYVSGQTLVVTGGN